MECAGCSTGYVSREFAKRPRSPALCLPGHDEIVLGNEQRGYYCRACASQGLPTYARGVRAYVCEYCGITTDCYAADRDLEACAHCLHGIAVFKGVERVARSVEAHKKAEAKRKTEGAWRIRALEAGQWI